MRRMLLVSLLAPCLCIAPALAAGGNASGGAPVKTIADLKPDNEVWDTYMGCLRGCLRYLHSDVTPAWLYGVSGHAFGLNIHKQLCPSGPHVWSGWGSLQGHEALLGLKIERVGAWYKGYDDAYEAHRKLAWERTRQAIDAGAPVIGYDFSMAEFYVVSGYDDAGYHYWNTNFGDLKQAGPVAWDKYGDGGGVHMIALQVVTAGKPTGTARQAVRAALQWAVDFGARGDADDPLCHAERKVSRLALDPGTVLINVPKLKTHNLGITTLCMKNLMGVVNVWDQSAIEERKSVERSGSGTVEVATDAQTMSGASSYVEYANMLLKQYCRSASKLSVSTTRPGLEAGQLARVDLPLLGAVGGFKMCPRKMRIERPQHRLPVRWHPGFKMCPRKMRIERLSCCLPLTIQFLFQNVSSQNED